MTAIVLTATAFGLWFIYWNLSWMMHIPKLGAPTNTALPMLELSPLGGALLVCTGGLVGALTGTTKVDDKVERTGLLVTLLFTFCALLLVFLKYGIVAPLGFFDYVFTLLYVGEFCMLVFIAARIIVRSLRPTRNVTKV